MPGQSKEGPPVLAPRELAYPVSQEEHLGTGGKALTDRTWVSRLMEAFGFELGSARWKLLKHPWEFSKGVKLLH